MENFEHVEVFESVASIQTDKKSRFLAYINAAIRAQRSETGRITEATLEMWGVQWVLVREHPAGTVIGTGFILRPSDTSNDYILSGLCYETNMVPIAESILAAAANVRNLHFPSRNLVIDLAGDNSEMQSAAEKVGFSSESSGIDDVWIRFSLQSEVESKIRSEVQPLAAKALPTVEGVQCGQCNKSFKTRFFLKRHSVSHSNNRPYSCNICAKKFKERRVLKSHVLRLHTATKHSECTECRKQFPTKYLLSEHIKAVHPVQLYFLCTECNKRFKTRATLNGHIVVHSNDRPFACDQCDKKFKRKFCLQSHLLHIHTVEKHFECAQCRKRFPTDAILSQHAKIVHTSQQDFECTECDKRFKT
eukprot:186108_1